MSVSVSATIRCTVMIWLFSLLLAVTQIANAQANNRAQQRQLFRVAERALQRGQIKTFKKHLQQLADYPLRPYLQYAYLTRRNRSLSQKQLDAFIARYPNSLLADRLRKRWLFQSARKKQWKNYLSYYQKRDANSTRLHCLAKQAQKQVHQRLLAVKEIQNIWLNARSLPRECNPIFNAWIKTGGLTTSVVLQRLRLSMMAGNTHLTRYLKRYLPKTQQNIIALWLNLRRRPSRLTKLRWDKKNHPLLNTVLEYTIKRLAARNLDRAVRASQVLLKTPHLSTKQQYIIQKVIAMRLALRRDKRARLWFAKMQQPIKDAQLAGWQIRMALLAQDWPVVQQLIHQLPTSEQDRAVWQYWKARALTGQKYTRAARQIYRQLAKQRHYYGLLANAALATRPRLTNQRQPISAKVQGYVSQLPGFQRAHELFLLNRLVKARREWLFVVERLQPHYLLAAAKLAEKWSWYDRAIATAAKAPFRDDLLLRFPLAERSFVHQAATRYQLDPAWIYAIARQESGFAPDARSPAGALGIMQLIPRTARSTARAIKVPYRKQLLFSPRVNIMLGSAHLQHLLRTYNHALVPSIAAYNAGTRHVNAWLKQVNPSPTDIWIETLPFKETRKYLKQVLIYMAIYRQHLGKSTRITDYFRYTTHRSAQKSAIKTRQAT